MSGLDHYRRLWNEKWLQPGRRGSKPDAHSVTAAALLQELRTLKSQTGDERFSAAIQAISDSNLFDDRGRWSRQRRRYWESIIYEIPDALVATIDRERADGASLAIACARLAVEWDEPADSFNGLIKTIEKLYRATKAAAGTDRAPENSAAGTQ